ncbi:MAG: acetylornithine deacetylase [Pseudomonadales bacterium]|nr:acetylornithine deacetylase [Halieaceae bacterium]MCP5163657.1 acetylornithine deacetylase [Pseudomonadales bacterium]MCP5189281.1 acetylornithine deacetylase [Pseudomonadales bacterium]MCP5204459.1 acetylornithine deacetylase [Pseudomonadales bacterium]
MPATDKLVIEQLRQLVSIPSVSSPDPLWDQGNRAVIDLLATWLDDLGFHIEIQEVSEDGAKANLIATLGSGPGGLVLAGHTDTVPFDEGRWQSDPLTLTERDQRLYGLGSTDMKGFFPLALAAAAAIRGSALKQPLILLATADEESSMNGARALVTAGYPRGRAAIIGEPTSLVPVRMHKGIMMEAVRVTGRAGHSSNPALGNSALDGMHAVMGDLMSYRQQLRQRFNHDLFEVAWPTLNLGCLHGGDSPNRICGQAELHFDLRMVPGGDNATVRGEIEQRMMQIARQHALEIELRSLNVDVAPYEQSADSDLVRLAEQLTGHRAEAVAFATEAPFMQQLGMETIVMGPGSIDRAHQPDEYLELEQIQPCISLLQQCIRHYCL